MYFIYVAYEFPPLQSGGVYRTLGLVNCLKNSGLTPIIITRNIDSIKSSEKEFHLDYSLINELNPEALVFRIPTSLNTQNKSNFRNKFRIISNPNGVEAKYWKRNVLNQLDDIVKKYKPQFVLTTAPPFSIIDLGYVISKKYKLRHIIDLRDAWSNWFTSPYFTYFHYLVKFRKEKFHLNSADKVIVTSKQTIDDFKKVHKQLNQSKFIYIPNGFDGPLLNWDDSCSVDKIKIGYVGSFYYQPEANDLMLSSWKDRKGHHKLKYSPNRQNWLYRSPYFFFKSIQKLILTHPEFQNKIELHFIGKKEVWFDNMVSEFSLKKQIFHQGVKDRSESINFQREMDWLLITSSKVIGGSDYSIAGKTFEYFQVQKPILAFVCKGAQRDLLMDSGQALICDPDNTEQSVKQMMEYFQKNKRLTPNVSFIKQHSRLNLSKIFVEELKNTI
jgi:hypothetical protein